MHVMVKQRLLNAFLLAPAFEESSCTDSGIVYTRHRRPTGVEAYCLLTERTFLRIYATSKPCLCIMVGLSVGIRQKSVIKPFTNIFPLLDLSWGILERPYSFLRSNALQPEKKSVRSA